MERDRPTKEVVRADGVDRYLDARAELLRMAEEVRSMGLGMQGDRLDAVATAIAPPSFPGILAALEDPEQPVSRKQLEFLVTWLTEAAQLIRDLQDDAEITGSQKALVASQRWLDRLGL